MSDSPVLTPEARAEAEFEKLGIATTRVVLRGSKLTVDIAPTIPQRRDRTDLRVRLVKETPLKDIVVGYTGITAVIPADWLLPAAPAPEASLPVQASPLIERIRATLVALGGFDDIKAIDPGTAADVFVVRFAAARPVDRNAWLPPVAKTPFKVIGTSIWTLTVRVPADWLSDAALEAILKQDKAEAARQTAILDELRRIDLRPTAITLGAGDGEYEVTFAEGFTLTHSARITRETAFVAESFINKFAGLISVPRDWPLDETAEPAAKSFDPDAALRAILDETDPADEPTNDIGTEPFPAVAIDGDTEPLPALDPLDDDGTLSVGAMFQSAIDNQDAADARAVAAEALADDRLIDLAEAQQTIARLQEQLEITNRQRDTYAEICETFNSGTLTVPTCKEFHIDRNTTEADMEHLASMGWTCAHMQFDADFDLATVWVRDVPAPAGNDPLRAAAAAAIPVTPEAVPVTAGGNIIIDPPPTGRLNLSPVMQRILDNPTQFPIARHLAEHGLDETRDAMNAKVFAAGQAAYDRAAAPTPVRPPVLIAAGD